MNDTEIRVFIQRNVPDLTPTGLDCECQMFSDYDIDAVKTCIDWINRFAIKTKTIRRVYSSYYLKHCVERWSGKYIPNGAFIAAAVVAGYRYRETNGINAHFNFTCKKGVGGVQ